MNNLENIKLAIIGAGRWGFNHVRTANQLLEAKNITVFDSFSSVESKIKELNSEINFTTEFDSVLENKTLKHF